MNRIKDISVAEWRRAWEVKPCAKRGIKDGNNWQAKVLSTSPLSVWLCIPSLPPSLNEWSRKHWRVRHRAVADMTANLSALALATRIPRVERAEVRLTYYFRDNRRRDPDNYAGKFILDGLRKAGIISDDNAGVLRLPQPEFHVDRQRPRTEVWIGEWQEEEIKPQA